MFNNPIRLMVISGGVLAAVIVWCVVSRLQADNRQWQQAHAAVTSERDSLHTALQQQRGQIEALLQVNRLQAAYTAELHTRLQASRDLANRRLTTLDTLTHDQSDNQHWGDTRLPDDLVRLLDFSPAQSTAHHGATVPKRHPVPAARPPADYQPPVGAQPDRTSAGAGSVRGTGGPDRTMSEGNAA